LTPKSHNSPYETGFDKLKKTINTV